jgi:hypothetical protein
MNEVRALLERMAGAIEPSPDAFLKVLAAIRRRRRRRIAAVVTSVALIAGGLAGVAIVGHTPRQRIQLADQLAGSRQALKLRSKLGIQGQTKGAPPVVIVQTKTKSGAVNVSAVQVQTGKSTAFPQGGAAEGATVSPKGDVVAAVKDDELVVTPTRNTPGAKPLVLPGATGTTGSVSWDRNGSALFAPVGGRWIRVSDPGGATGPQMLELQVPAIPGGPILLSVSPTGTQVLLFGITLSPDGSSKPHLYLGQFDGTTVSDSHPIDVPDAALSGPLGWVGDNAFLLSSGPGQALIVRTDGGGSIPIQAETMPDPCSLAPAGSQCSPGGPWLLGTNGDGSLLFWQVTGTVPATSPSGEAAGVATAPTGGPSPSAAAVGGSPTGPLVLVLYYKTWLDGTHVVRLTGEVGKYGPPVAAR